MDAIDIVTLIAIILFARLGLRLVGKYLSMKKEPKKMDDSVEGKEEE
jgi:hypothetical protein